MTDAALLAATCRLLIPVQQGHTLSVQHTQTHSLMHAFKPSQRQAGYYCYQAGQHARRQTHFLLKFAHMPTHTHPPTLHPTPLSSAPFLTDTEIYCNTLNTLLYCQYSCKSTHKRHCNIHMIAASNKNLDFIQSEKHVSVTWTQVTPTGGITVALKK